MGLAGATTAAAATLLVLFFALRLRPFFGLGFHRRVVLRELLGDFVLGDLKDRVGHGVLERGFAAVAVEAEMAVGGVALRTRGDERVHHLFAGRPAGFLKERENARAVLGALALLGRLFFDEFDFARDEALLETRNEGFGRFGFVDDGRGRGDGVHLFFGFRRTNFRHGRGRFGGLGRHRFGGAGFSGLVGGLAAARTAGARGRVLKLELHFLRTGSGVFGGGFLNRRFFGFGLYRRSFGSGFGAFRSDRFLGHFLRDLGRFAFGRAAAATAARTAATGFAFLGGRFRGRFSTLLRFGHNRFFRGDFRHGRFDALFSGCFDGSLFLYNRGFSGDDFGRAKFFALRVLLQGRTTARTTAGLFHFHGLRGGFGRGGLVLTFFGRFRLRTAATARAAFVHAGAVTAAFARASAAVLAVGLGLLFFALLGLGLFGRVAAEVLEEVHDAGEEALFALFGHRRHRDGAQFGAFRLLGLFDVHGRGIARKHVLDDGNLLGTSGLFFVALHRVRIVRLLHFKFGDALEALNMVVETVVVLTDAFDVIVRRLERRVRDEDDRHAVTRFEHLDVAALLVQKEGRDVDRNLRVHGARAFLHGFFLQDAQDLNGAGFGVADDAHAVAAGAGHVAPFGERRTQTLAREFHQAETRDLGHLHAGAVVVERVLEALFDGALVLRVEHVDEVDHDETTQVAQTHLAGHFVGRFAVRAEGRLFNVGAARGARRVDVDRDERFGVVDHDRAARGKRNRARIGRFDLMFDLEARKERDVLVVALDAVDHVGHDVRHELPRLLVDFVRVDEDFTDFGLEVVADGANDEVRLFDDEEGRGVGALERLAVHDGRVDERGRLAAVFFRDEFVLGLGGLGDRLPELEEVVQVPLQLFGAAADPGRAGDHGHARRALEAFHRGAQFLTLFAFDAARDAAAARIVRHEDEIAAGEADEGRERSALVAALFLFDLNDDFLAFFDGFADRAGAHVDAFLEVGAGDFLEGEEAVALFAVVDEARFKARFDAGDDALVDVGLAGFAAGRLNVDVDESLPVDDAHTRFFGVRGVEKHTLHVGSTPVVGRALHTTDARLLRATAFLLNADVSRRRTEKRNGEPRRTILDGRHRPVLCPPIQKGRTRAWHGLRTPFRRRVGRVTARPHGAPGAPSLTKIRLFVPQDEFPFETLSGGEGGTRVRGGKSEGHAKKGFARGPSSKRRSLYHRT